MNQGLLCLAMECFCPFSAPVIFVFPIIESTEDFNKLLEQIKQQSKPKSKVGFLQASINKWDELRPQVAMKFSFGMEVKARTLGGSD